MDCHHSPQRGMRRRNRARARTQESGHPSAFARAPSAQDWAAQPQDSSGREPGRRGGRGRGRCTAQSGPQARHRRAFQPDVFSADSIDQACEHPSWHQRQIAALHHQIQRLAERLNLLEDTSRIHP